MKIDVIKYNYRQSKDGHIMAFVLHPHDELSALTNAPIGSQWQIEIVPLDEEGNPVARLRDNNRKEGVANIHSKQQPPLESAPVSSPEQHTTPTAVRAHKSWAETPYVTQAAIRCGEQDFQRFLSERFPVAWAGMNNGTNNEKAAEIVRWQCKVKSRSEIKPGTEAGIAWARIDIEYFIWLRGAAA